MADERVITVEVGPLKAELTSDSSDLDNERSGQESEASGNLSALREGLDIWRFT